MRPRGSRGLAALLVVSTASSASADQVLVLKSEGRADPAVRARVDATVARLAAAGQDEVSPGEITYTEAAALVGCKPEDTACRDEVIGMLAVDEIVIVTVTPKPGGFDVLVRRARRGAVTRDASTLIRGDGADHLDAIAPLFGGTAAARAVTGPEIPRPTGPATELPGPPTSAAPTDAAALTGVLPDRDLAAVDPHPDQRLHTAGIVSGGVLVLLGGIFWGSAASVASEIDDAPDATVTDLLAIEALESEGDTYAALGNVFLVSGLVIGGISTYFYVRGRNRNRNARALQLAPVIMSNGTGIGLSFGGTL